MEDHVMKAVLNIVALNGGGYTTTVSVMGQDPPISGKAHVDSVTVLDDVKNFLALSSPLAVAQIAHGGDDDSKVVPFAAKPDES